MTTTPIRRCVHKMTTCCPFKTGKPRGVEKRVGHIHEGFTLFVAICWTCCHHTKHTTSEVFRVKNRRHFCETENKSRRVFRVSPRLSLLSLVSLLCCVCVWLGCVFFGISARATHWLLHGCMLNRKTEWKTSSRQAVGGTSNEPAASAAATRRRTLPRLPSSSPPRRKRRHRLLEMTPRSVHAISTSEYAARG